jgi:hypothetical protein
VDTFRQDYCVSHDDWEEEGKVPIRFLGVWDTVDAVGLPSDFLADRINQFIYRFKFPDLCLSNHVEQARHALAVDDQRKTFHPVMWDEQGDSSDHLQQVWFSGVHSNVGGGYSRHGMSLVSLDWMMTEAEQAGLRFIPSIREAYHFRQNVNDKLFDSRRGRGAIYRYRPRDIGRICVDSHHDPRLHASIFERIIQGTNGYAPGNLPLGKDVELVSNEVGHEDDAIHEHYNTIKQVIRQASPLLPTVRWKGVWRRHAIWLFLIGLAAVVYAGLQPGLEGDCLWSMAVSFTLNLISCRGAASLVFLLILGVISWQAREQMQASFSRFWCAQFRRLHDD